ncbi:hypothetical protein BASA81_004876 [Batrachochytrium salamandrivorans]|nr:hypothetical protein BASA81_004876 [Batrachochytrium salamandrivorans]
MARALDSSNNAIEAERRRIAKLLRPSLHVPSSGLGARRPSLVDLIPEHCHHRRSSEALPSIATQSSTIRRASYQEPPEDDSFQVQVVQIKFLLDYARGLLVAEEGEEEEEKEEGDEKGPLLPEVAAMKLAKQKRHEEHLRRTKAKQYDLNRRRRLIAQANPPNATAGSA